MPNPSAHTLIWSAENHRYLLYTPDHPPQVITSENEDVWHAWLDTHSSFSFQGQHGHLNVLKETRARGTGYWYAYSKSAGQTSKRYLGHSAKITLARLEEIAHILQKHHSEHAQAAPALISTQTAHVSEETSRGMLQQGSELRETMVVTRFSPPRPPAPLVVRERLLSLLDAAFSRPLTLLSASAGWGKTTLLSAWAHQHPHAIAWLSLETLDNDPRRFWLSIIAALRRCRPAIGGRVLTLLQAPTPEPLSLSVTTLLNELAERNEEPLLLILDDYHVIEEATIHTFLAFFLEHLPIHVHLVLASRVDPDLPLARFRVRGSLGEIRTTDLRFTREETQHFLTQRMELALSETDVGLLQTRTEGWIASLQLAALVLQNHADPSIYVQTLSGSQRFVLDYLREEILASLSAELQAFLLQTSWLNPLSASLCDAVRGREDSARLLEQVERANLFLQPLDERRQWYRYHALWAQAMQHEARLRLGAAALRVLRSKASQWYEQQQMLPEAIEAALAGEDFGRAASLIERFVIPQSFRNAYHTLSRWLKQLPEEIVRAQPDLCLLFVLALTFTTDRRSSETWEQVERLLQWAKQGFEATRQWEQLGEALQLHAELAFFQGDLEDALPLSRQARPLLSEHSLMYPDNVGWSGLEAFLAGEMEAAWSRLLEAYRRAKNLSLFSSAISASLLLSAVCLEQGNLRRASYYCRQALTHMNQDQEISRQQLLLETGEEEPFFASWAYHCLAQLSYECNELADARQTLSQALALREKPETGVHVLASGSFIQARLLHAGGETTLAQDVLSQWEMHTHSPWSLRVLRVYRARLQLAAGDPSAIELWAQEKDQAFSSQAPELEEELPLMLQQEEALLLVRLHIAQKRGEAALNELAPWKEKALAQGRKHSVLEIQILEALAHFVRQEHSQARISLLHALRLAHSENYQRLFLDEGPAMEALLNMLLPELRETSLISHARTLLSAFAQESGAQPKEETASIRKDVLLLEPLSEQEQRILRLLVAGRSNPEIANALVISVNTVKTHVQSLYRKLDVHNRVEASSVAQRLSLL
ncbi:LuxR C-terminal-related transcriptional regulator [Ktedonospora formicarum]|uniref:Helix-turn-helix transcriptional regulator n=1 Tax=Ktedonospora formicarum TaxID=2778364 RepID=A0A8J3MVB9_9CHLR|nr:LuxR C-terminal-related transcriptional regulator [Ktedonospora formicarum]GHO47786.1 helix-turn-helix transcriptional regulator [Ktedonospora formicarum]